MYKLQGIFKQSVLHVYKFVESSGFSFAFECGKAETPYRNAPLGMATGLMFAIANDSFRPHKYDRATYTLAKRSKQEVYVCLTFACMMSYTWKAKRFYLKYETGNEADDANLGVAQLQIRSSIAWPDFSVFFKRFKDQPFHRPRIKCWWFLCVLKKISQLRYLRHISTDYCCNLFS